MFLAGVGDLLCTVAFSHHNHAAAETLESVDVRVHTLSGCGAERARRHALRRFGRAGVINRVLFEVFGHRFAFVEHLIYTLMGDVARNDKGAFNVETRLNRVFGEFFAHFVHWAVDIEFYGGLHVGSLFWQEACRVLFKFF